MKNAKMNRRNFIKGGMSVLAGLLSTKSSAKGNIISGREYTKIEWLLYKDKSKKIYGSQPSKNLKSLEELVFTEKDPRKIELTEWEITAFAKLVPIKKLIEKHAHYYSIDPVWATMFFTFESSLKPTDYNQISTDFGLGQIKRSSERLAKRLGTSLSNKFYSPYLNKEKIIFDPETNIIMSMLLHRYNIERYNLRNSDQAYAVYVKGRPGLGWFGSISKSAKAKLDAFYQRYYYFQNIIPLFRLEKDEIASKNKDTMTLLEIYHSNLDVEETYKKELDYFLNDLGKNIKGDARSVLVYDDCVTFAMTLDAVWDINQTKNYERLSDIRKKLSELVIHRDLKERVEKTTEILRRRGDY